MTAILTAIGGYALGTLQVLALEWFRVRAEHRRHLRVIRAELRRAKVRRAKFGWVEGQIPVNYSSPEPPLVSDAFVSTISATDFSLTDEFEGDNSHEGMLTLLDGFDQLARYRDDAQKCIEDLRNAETVEDRMRAHKRAFGFAASYDRVSDEVAFQLDSALDDVARRLLESGFWRQLSRQVRSLPEGEAPPPLGRDDPRLLEWRARSDEKPQS